MAGGYTVQASALTEAAQGIGDAIGAQDGKGLSGLSLSGTQVGYPDLESAFSDFCSRWSPGIQALVSDGRQFAERLCLNVENYTAAEQESIEAITRTQRGAQGPGAGTAPTAQAS